MASRRTGGSQIVFQGTRPISVRSGGSKASNSTAQVGLARRLLFPQQVPALRPPPILGTTSNDKFKDSSALKALNDELYEFLALALRAFILPWWSKISPRDKEFLQEITRIVTHLAQALESRVLAADIPSLVARTLPTLITQHYIDYRTAQVKLHTSYSTSLHGSSNSLPRLFHSLQPHMAISAEGAIDADYVRQAVEYIMKACLPQEDWQAETERNIVREIVVKIVIEDIFPRLTQPWFLHKGLLEALGLPEDSATQSSPPPRASFTFDTVVIFILSAVQTVSGFALAVISNVQACLHIISEVNNIPTENQHVYASSDDLASPSLEMIAEMLTMRERAAASSILALMQIIVGFLVPFLNRLIPYLLYAQMQPSIFTKVVIQAKKVMFPNGYPGPPPVEPTIEEQVILREQLEKRLFGLVPTTLAKILFGPTLDVQSRTVKAILDPLNDSKCNTHLLMFTLDAILVSLFPELGLGMQGEDSEALPEDGASDPPTPFGASNGVNDRPLSSSETPDS